MLLFADLAFESLCELCSLLFRAIQFTVQLGGGTAGCAERSCPADSGLITLTRIVI